MTSLLQKIQLGNIQMEEMPRARYGRGGEAAMLWMDTHFPQISMCSPAQKLYEHHPFGFSWRRPYIGTIA